MGVIIIIVDPDKLQLLTAIGSGAFGQVYKAIYKGTVVAAKKKLYWQAIVRW